MMKLPFCLVMFFVYQKDGGMKIAKYEVFRFVHLLMHVVHQFGSNPIFYNSLEFILFRKLLVAK